LENCIKQCANPTTTPPPNPCVGDNACKCPYDQQCALLRRAITVQTTDAVSGVATTAIKYKQECTRLSSPFINDPATTVLTARPDLCFAVQDALVSDDAGNNKPELEKKAAAIDTDMVQQKVADLVTKVAEAKDFIVTVKNQLTPEKNDDDSVKVSVVVTVTGDRSPTDGELNAICSKVVVDAVQQVLDSTKQITLTLKNCDKIVGSVTKKRGVLGTSSQGVLVAADAANVPTNPGSSGSSSAATLFMSLTALFLATLALFI